MSDPVIGQAINASRVDVVFPFKEGIVGRQERGDFIEIAYLGVAPKDLPVTGTIAGQAATALTARTTNVDGSNSRQPRTMAVVTCRLDQAAG